MSTAQSSTSEFQVELISLHCVNKSDLIGLDEPRLEVRDVHVFDPGTMTKGDTVDLQSQSAPLTNAAEISLIEIDNGEGGEDDDLGTITAQASQVNQGEQFAVFNKLPNTEYILTYRVVPA